MPKAFFKTRTYFPILKSLIPSGGIASFENQSKYVTIVTSSRRKKYLITLTDKEKSLDKIQHPLMIGTPRKSEYRGTIQN